MVSQLTMPESCSCYKYFDQIKMNILHVHVFCVFTFMDTLSTIFSIIKLHGNIDQKTCKFIAQTVEL